MCFVTCLCGAAKSQIFKNWMQNFTAISGVNLGRLFWWMDRYFNHSCYKAEAWVHFYNNGLCGAAKIRWLLEKKVLCFIQGLSLGRAWLADFCASLFSNCCMSSSKDFSLLTGTTHETCFKKDIWNSCWIIYPLLTSPPLV